MKEKMQYSLELKIDDQVYTLSGPAYAPVHALYDAASQFFLIVKDKMDKINKKLEEDAKNASSGEASKKEESPKDVDPKE